MRRPALKPHGRSSPPTPQLVDDGSDYAHSFWVVAIVPAGAGRKRVGVEPTKNRLTALSGFEGQPPHRERFPSVVDNCPEPARCHRSAAAG
jgi:hypothetical protein